MKVKCFDFPSEPFFFIDSCYLAYFVALSQARTALCTGGKHHITFSLNYIYIIT
jgi:hypothetical protein